jgi:AraC-like DNA-binding protein
MSTARDRDWNGVVINWHNWTSGWEQPHATVLLRMACPVLEDGAMATHAARQPSRLAPRTLTRITGFIDAHLHEPIDLATLAQLANVSRFHFARLFRATMGISAMAYLERCRMERAQALIRRGGLQLAGVASLVGYDDPSYFTRRFRHYCGQTPSAWARSH